MSIFVTSDLPKKPEVRYRSLAFAVKIDLRKTTWSVTPKRMKFKKNEPRGYDTWCVTQFYEPVS